MLQEITSLLNLIRHPVAQDTSAQLQSKWRELPEALQTLQQIYGRGEEGCGATAGVMPRCTFACRGCYLGRSANTTPPLPLEAVKRQLRVLRRYLGRWGNLQLTDGEVTLRPVEELIEILRYARKIELIPMLMTHGDTFRRQPGLLERLMVEGGLDEMSLHIDTTQRGRVGDGYKNATREPDLHPLRNEFSEIIRQARKRTGRPLRVASTLTIDRDNLDDIPSVIAWFKSNTDAFRLVSFQPMAQVGRTEWGRGGLVTMEALWEKIAEGLYGTDRKAWTNMHRSQWWMGHPSCNRWLMGFVVEQKKENAYYTLSMNANLHDRKVLNAFYEHFGGLTFRADTRTQAAARCLGMLLRAPGFIGYTLPRYAWHLLHQVDPAHPVRLALRLLTRRARVRRLTVASHHFMSRAELETDEGKQRLEHCVFKVPVQDKMISMCAFNVQGGREHLYAQMATWKKPEEVLHV